MLQAEFFGLPGLADKASLGLDADSGRIQGEAAGPSHASPAGDIQFDSVYLETGFHPVKSEFDVLQQQQAATMQVRVQLETRRLAQSTCSLALISPWTLVLEAKLEWQMVTSQPYNICEAASSLYACNYSVTQGLTQAN